MYFNIPISLSVLRPKSKNPTATVSLKYNS